MKNNKLKLISILSIIFLLYLTPNINAIENKTEKKEDISAEIIINKKQEEELEQLLSINQSLIYNISKFKKLIYYFKTFFFTIDKLQKIKEDYNFQKTYIEKIKNEYSEILNNNIEKSIESKEIINEITKNIKDAKKLTDLIDKKIENYDNSNNITHKENNLKDLIPFIYSNIKNLEKEIKKSFDINKNILLYYANSISNLSPIEKIILNKKNYETSCKETINLIKKYDDIKTKYNKLTENGAFVLSNKIDETIEEIENIIESFLIFYLKGNEHIFYSFLKRFKNTTRENEINLNFATRYNSVKDTIESKINNIEQLNIPTIKTFLTELEKNDKFDIKNKFLLEKEKLNPICYEQIKSYLEILKKNLENFKNQYNKTKKSYLTHLGNIKISKDEYNDNFEINKKFMYSFSKDNYFKLHKELKSQYKKCNDIFNYLNCKQIVFNQTKNELENMKNSYLNQFLNIYESDINSYLSLAIDNFYESLTQQKNTKENQNEIFVKYYINNFFKNYSKAKEKCYELNKQILNINRYNKINKTLKEKEENLKNYTALLRGYYETPFINILIKNTEKEKKGFESLKFIANIKNYKTKIIYFLNTIKSYIANFINTKYISNINNIIKLKATSNIYDIIDILKLEKNILENLKNLIEECKEYIYNASKELIEKNKKAKIEIYKEKTLKEKIYSILSFIEQIEKAGSDEFLDYTKITLNIVHNTIISLQNEIKKNKIIISQTDNSTIHLKLHSFLINKGIQHIYNFFKIFIEYKPFRIDDIDKRYEEYFKKLEKAHTNKI